MLRVRSDSNAHRDKAQRLLLTMRECKLRNALQDPFGYDASPSDIGLTAENHELLAAVSSGCVRVSHALLYNGRNPAKDIVSGGMPVLIVIFLEMINVTEHDRIIASVSSYALIFKAELLAERPYIGDLSEFVSAAQFLDLSEVLGCSGRELSVLGDVARDHLEELGPVLRGDYTRADLKSEKSALILTPAHVERPGMVAPARDTKLFVQRRAVLLGRTKRRDLLSQEIGGFELEDLLHGGVDVDDRQMFDVEKEARVPQSFE